MRLKDKFLVLIIVGGNWVVDGLEDDFEKAFYRARVIRRSMSVPDGVSLPVVVARIVEVYD